MKRTGAYECLVHANGCFQLKAKHDSLHLGDDIITVSAKNAM